MCLRNSDWPTIPQVYVDGEFVGGCDIIMGSEYARDDPIIILTDLEQTSISASVRGAGKFIGEARCPTPATGQITQDIMKKVLAIDYILHKAILLSTVYIKQHLILQYIQSLPFRLFCLAELSLLWQASSLLLYEVFRPESPHRP